MRGGNGPNNNNNNNKYKKGVQQTVEKEEECETQRIQVREDVRGGEGGDEERVEEDEAEEDEWVINLITFV